MNKESRGIQRIYLSLTLSNTLAASFIWGINTLFLLDAGLSNAEAFAANAFFTLGTMLFEVPTGVVADTWGRRASYLIGTITLLVSTLLYLWMWQVQAPFYGWALSSVFLGLGFTFFSGCDSRGNSLPRHIGIRVVGNAVPAHARPFGRTVPHVQHMPG